MVSSLAIEVIKQHYESFWNADSKTHRLNGGPIHDLPDGFCILEFAPRAKCEWIYSTCGMSLVTKGAPIEVFLLSPCQSRSHIKLLYGVADYNLNVTKLGLNHSVDFGRPWLPSSLCSYGMLSLPYLDGPKLEQLEVNGREVQVLWLIPITYSETEYKIKNGSEALEQKFEKAMFNYIDPSRASVFE